MCSLLGSGSKVGILPEELEEKGASRSVLVKRPGAGRIYPANQRLVYHFKPRLPIRQRETAILWDLKKNSLAEDQDAKGMIRNYNPARLIMLIDQLGSMEPFSLIVEVLKKSVSHMDLFDKTDLYYFHDCPEGFLCKQPSLAVTMPLEEILSKRSSGSSVLIVSDAGAARGHYDRRRVADTRTFLQILRTHNGSCVWLNPMPTNRWEATTANDIRHMVSMFPLDREGLNGAITVLIKQLLPAGVHLDE